MKKLNAILVVLIISSFLVVAAKAVEQIKPTTYIYPYPNDYPNVLVFKGVAVKNSKVSPSVMVGMDKTDNFEYKVTYLLLGEKLYQLELDEAKYDEKSGTWIVEFDVEDSDKNLKLIVKYYQWNILVASGQFGDYLLNLRLVGNEDIYRILQPIYEEKIEPTYPTYETVEPTRIR